MDKKKKLVYFVSIFLFNVFLLNTVSAQSFFGSLDIRHGAEQVIDIVVDFAEPFLQVLLGGEDYTGLLLFERFLIFVLLLSIIYLSLKNIMMFRHTPSVLWIVSIIVPLIAVRFIDYAWLNTILLQYQVLGIAIAGILPFIIYMFFIYNTFVDWDIARKIGWIFFIAVYLGLWSTTDVENYAQIYFWTMLVALAFLLFDGPIRKVFKKQKWKEADRGAIIDLIAEKSKKLNDIKKSSNLTEREKQIRIDELEQEIKDLRKQL